MRDCSKCGGSGRIPCFQCMGSRKNGNKDCSYCGGDGEQTCPVCSGSGESDKD